MRCGLFCAGLIVAAAGLGGPRGARADSPATQIPAVVEQYAAALERLERSRGRAPVESLYAAAMDAAERVVEQSEILEKLDDTTFAKVLRMMRGCIVLRNDVYTGVTPDPDFFASLARSRGDAADTAFFHALGATHDAGNDLPVYLEQVSDYTACTDFGSGRLVGAFAVWQAFVALHPRRYAVWANEELREMEDELTTGNCACGDRESVLKELRGFVSRFPRAPVTPRVRKRLEAIRSGRVEIRYHCSPS